MPYPAKTNAEQILTAAVALLERDGQAKLSLRALATELKLTPNALYRYFPTREALLAAIAVQGAQWLLDDLQATLRDSQDLTAVAHRYLRFAAERPALYDLYMTCSGLSPQQREVYDQQWALVVQALSPLAGPRNREAALTLWAYLHGLVGLERSGVYDASSDKPRHTSDFGLAVLLAGFQAQTPSE